MKLGQYLGYGAGDAANNLTFSTVSAFLLIYYTNVAGITAAAAGTLFLVVRIWGGFTDLFAGRRVDETQTRWGKFRPYLLFGPVPLLVLLVAVFSIPGGLSLGGKLAWAYVSYALFQLAYSFVNIPYGSLSAAMTQVPDDRAKLSTSRSIAASVTILVIAVVVSPEISGGGRSAALTDHYHGGVRDHRVRAVPVVLRHLTGDGAARRGEGQPAGNAPHDAAQPAAGPALRGDPAVPQRDVLAADRRRLLRPRRARQRQLLHRADRRVDRRHDPRLCARPQGGRDGRQEAHLPRGRRDRRRQRRGVCRGARVGPGDRHSCATACSASGWASSTR